MTGAARSRYEARFAETPEDVLKAQHLRFRAFVDDASSAASSSNVDADRFDPLCRHVLVESKRTGELAACFRILPLADGGQISSSYAAQYYGLSGLSAFPGRMAEMGRFCVVPGLRDPDAIRVAWSAMSRFVDDEGVDLLFGCSSFHGTEAERYLDAFAMLNECHLAPKRWLPKVKAPDVFRFARRLGRTTDAKRAILTMPPLLRSYLAMGGWVSDHAVVDRDLGTLHVFTGLEISAIPAARARLLRAMVC
ncbi:MAG: GNAT family N-acyltransferase [Pseudomonadota bacterium]